MWLVGIEKDSWMGEGKMLIGAWGVGIRENGRVVIFLITLRWDREVWSVLGRDWSSAMGVKCCGLRVEDRDC